MPASHLRNITVKKYKKFLKAQGCVHTRTEGGHEIWTKEGLLRPIVVQNHIEPIPEFIIQNGFKALGLTKKQALALL